MAFLTILMLLQISSINSFILTNSSFTGTRVTSFEYQHLFQLILDGQTRITNLAQDLRTLRTNNDQEFKKIESQHKLELSATKMDMDLKLNVTKMELDASKIALQDQINKSKLLGLELERAKANSHQLQLELTKIKNQFQNMSLTFNDLHTSLAKVETEKNATRKTMIENRKAIASNLAILSTFNTSLLRTMTKMSSSDAAITQLQQKTGESYVLYISLTHI